MDNHVYIRGEIGAQFFSKRAPVTLRDVRHQVEAKPKADRLVVHLQTPGGLCTVGYQIANYLRSTGKYIDIVIEKLCGSIGTVIACAGNRVSITKGSRYFVHLPWCDIKGANTENMPVYLELMKREEDRIIETYSQFTGLNERHLRQLMSKESSLTDEQALKYGFAHHIIEAGQLEAVNMSFPINSFAALRTYNEQEKIQIAARLSSGNQHKNAILMDNKRKPKVSFWAAMRKTLMGQPLNLTLTDATGNEVNIDTEAEEPAVEDYVTLNGEAAPGATIVMSDGSSIVLNEESRIVEIKAEEVTSETETEAEVLSLLRDQVKDMANIKQQLANMSQHMEKKEAAHEKEMSEMRKRLGLVASTFKPDKEERTFANISDEGVSRTSTLLSQARANRQAEKAKQK